MNRIYILFIFYLALLHFNNLSSQLSITATETDFTLSFDNTVLGINEGQFEGSGFTYTPTNGQLDSDGIIATGFADGSLNFGDTATSGDFALGIHNGGTIQGGIYAFEVNTGDRALGVQPIGSDFTPGSFLIRVVNNTGSIIESVNFSYDIYVLNNEDRSNSFNSAWSVDNINYNQLAALDYTSLETSDPSPNWIQNNRSTSFNVTLNNGDTLYFKWTGDDVGGSGSRDEFALDNIIVNMSTMVLPVTWLTFKATERNQKSILQWTTTSEINNSHFVIVHSIDGRSWADVGRVKAVTRQSAINHYEFIHKNPDRGMNYYRLRQVDIDGGTDHSIVQRVNIHGKQQREVTLYPNPAAERLYLNDLQWKDDTEVFIYSISGDKVHTVRKPSAEIPIHFLPSGVYFLMVTSGEESQQYRFIKG